MEGGGGGVQEGRHIDNECMRSQGRIRIFQKGVFLTRDMKRGGGGRRAACRTMIYKFVCVIVRGGGAGGGNWCQRGGISYE